MGSIYRVRDTAANNREAALKVLNPGLLTQDESASERFRREAVIAAGLKHPNIVEVYDFSLDPSGPLIMAMEYVDGVSLAQRITSNDIGRLSFPQIVRILKDIAAGLAFAHMQGVVHRDLKPANILIGPEGVAKIADFGLCRSEIFDKGLTHTGECVGTPLYMAPEQISSGQADSRSDIYSFGILAYEAVTGRVPFNGDTWFEIAEKHLTGKLPPIDLQLPGWFDELLRICTEKEPKNRFCSGMELQQWLDDATVSGDHRPQLFPEETLSAKMSFALVALCTFLVVSIGLSSGMLNSVFNSVQRFLGESSSPLPASAFVPTSHRLASDDRLHRNVSPPPQKGKVYVCLVNGSHVFTTEPPRNTHCLEAK